MIVQSSFKEAPAQNGVRWVTETHTDDRGAVYTYEWQGNQDAATVLQARADRLNVLIAQYRAAEVFVADTELGWEPLEYLRRFHLPEEAAIRSASKTDPIVETLLARISTVKRIYPSHPETIQGIQYLVDKGLITETRAEEILNG